MATQALYRQWRPHGFHDMVGQEAVVTTLRNQVAAGRIAHAYLFCGSRGTGKTSMAKIMARAVNCQSPVNGEPCGVCDACQKLAAENNLDVVEIDAASNNGVDEIRDLREKVKYPPQHGRYRVYIIDEVHMLSTGAFNALLKTLEEPPAHVVFILATTEPQKLPATILSRCQRYDFHRIPAVQIAGRLREAVRGADAEASEEALQDIARAAEGGMRDALSILDMCLSFGSGTIDAALVREVLGTTDRVFLFAFAAALLDDNAGDALRAIDTLIRGGKEPQVFCRDVVGHIRALLLAQTCGESLAALLECTQEDAAQYQTQCKQATRAQLLRLLDLFIDAQSDMKWASQPRVALEIAAVRGCLPEPALQLEALLLRVEQLEKQMATGAVARAKTHESTREVVSSKATALQKAEAVPASASTIWEHAMLQLKKMAPMLFAPLQQGRMTGMTDDVFVVQFEPNQAIYCNMLSMPARKQAVEQILCEAAGRPIHLEVRIRDEKVQAPSLTANLQRAVDLFGRENVQILDE